ncbi:hypothetical protein CAC42_5323 [Sphaceloma murrayae]|uniref:SNF7 family protein n=1 Tax=Sphaceloma murrayae TaxID=2082308 RepID=A0A2K1QUP0_9PEZI|nr:hypothetical protein CAC42_5323 [Sphaceloma murrayae]
MTSPLSFLQTHLPAFRSPARVSSLYSSFANQRSLNPDGYNANIAAWLSALTLLSRHGLLPSSSSSPPSPLILSSSSSLPEALAVQQRGPPLSLAAVVHEGLQSGQLIPLQEFLNRETSIYHNGWMVPSPLQVVKWGLAQLGLGVGASDKLVQGEFVVRALVEAVGAEVARDVTGLKTEGVTGRLMPRAEFEDRFKGVLRDGEGGVDLSSRDMEVVLKFLERERGLLSFGRTAVKIAGSEGWSPVTKEDESVANIRGLITGLSRQVDELTQRIGLLDNEARAAVKDRQNTKAKRALRSKKLAEGMLEERSSMLETLEKTWRSIEVASDNVAIVEAMREGRDVLKGLNEKVGGAEGVEDVMEGLQEQMGIVEDVTGVINEQNANAVDEREVDDELEALEREEKDKLEAQAPTREEHVRAQEHAEQAKKETADLEALKKRLEGVDVPMSEPNKPEHEDEEDEQFEEASEMAQ